MTQFGGSQHRRRAIGQDGSETGYLRSFAIADDGSVSGVFSNGRSKVLAQLAMASFTNPNGLVKAGEGHLRAAGRLRPAPDRRPRRRRAAARWPPARWR